MKRLNCFRGILFFISMLLFSAVPVIADDSDSAYDFSFLDDMSLKELRALQAELNKILGTGDTTEAVSEATQSSEEFTEEEEFAARALAIFIDCLKNPHSMKLYRISVWINDSISQVCFEYSAENNLGGGKEEIRTLFMLTKDSIDETLGEVEDHIKVMGLDYVFKVVDKFKSEADFFTELDADKILEKVMSLR